MADPHTEKDEVDELLCRIRAARAINSRRINNAAMKLVDAACFSDTHGVIEMACQIVEDSKVHGALIKWAEALRLAHRKFLAEHDAMIRLPQEMSVLAALEGGGGWFVKPILNRVTITGADDSVDPKDLKRLQDEFPFVEWGILVSEHRTLDGGCARFPSSSFLARLDPALQLNLSVHLCGRWVRQVCKADWSWLDKSFDVGMLLGQAQRVQLNFHSYIHKVDREQLAKDLQNYLAPRQVICQVDGVNDDIVSHLYDDGCDVAALYDSSSGAGKLPSTWLVPLVGIPCGYAGGLSPENVEEQLELLSAFVKEAIWIDVETRVRSDDDQQFDFDRVHAFLEKTAPWVVKQGTTDAVKILHDRYVGDDPVRQMALEAERRLADEEQRRYDAGELTDEDF